MLGKKNRSVFKTRVCRKKVLSNLCQGTRIDPYCTVCRKSFKNMFFFEEHLKTREHKMVDSPLEYILQRVEESESPERPREFENLRLRVDRSESGQLRRDQEGININSVAIGMDCISSVRVSFCRVCNKFLPEDGLPDVLRRHSMTPEHVRRLNGN